MDIEKKVYCEWLAYMIMELKEFLGLPSAS